jgi:hypothetical protein
MTADANQTEELIRQGLAARCPTCHQVVETRANGTARSFVPHFLQAGQRKICPNSGKQVATEPAPAPLQRPPTGKDLSAFLTRDFLKVILSKREAEPSIEELTLEYLDKSDRVRLQIEALREMLGPDFRMKPYPRELQKPFLAVWGNAGACVIAKKHAQGGYQQMSDGEAKSVLEDINRHKALFYQ